MDLWIFYYFLMDFLIPGTGMNDGHTNLGGLRYFHFGLLGIDVVLCKYRGSFFSKLSWYLAFCNLTFRVGIADSYHYHVVTADMLLTSISEWNERGNKQ